LEEEVVLFGSGCQALDADNAILKAQLAEARTERDGLRVQCLRPTMEKASIGRHTIGALATMAALQKRRLDHLGRRLASSGPQQEMVDAVLTRMWEDAESAILTVQQFVRACVSGPVEWPVDPDHVETLDVLLTKAFEARGLQAFALHSAMEVVDVSGQVDLDENPSTPPDAPIHADMPAVEADPSPVPVRDPEPPPARVTLPYGESRAPTPVPQMPAEVSAPPAPSVPVTHTLPPVALAPVEPLTARESATFPKINESAGTAEPRRLRGRRPCARFRKPPRD
jgi:hypothetical protein